MWKLEFIEGALWFVVKELKESKIDFEIKSQDSRHIYLESDSISPDLLLGFKTITKLYYVVQNDLYSPKYLSKHKSIVKEVVTHIDNLVDFKSFTLKCAGKNTEEVISIQNYLTQELKLPHTNIDSDLKIQIIKIANTWEVSVEMTVRPLSIREYRASHIRGALNPTIAYSMCILGKVENAHKILNPFCGSGTLLIEAVARNNNLSQVIGFDIDKEALSASYSNIKSAGLVKKVDIKSLDIMESPSFSSKFDVIVSDLPFGMIISKYQNLEDLYKTYIELAEKYLKKDGLMVTITSQQELLTTLIETSKFTIVKEFELKQMTSVDAYLKTKIFVCKL
jgi:23S rRNA G2445 N2-methylase RlmL